MCVGVCSYVQGHPVLELGWRMILSSRGWWLGECPHDGQQREGCLPYHGTIGKHRLQTNHLAPALYKPSSHKLHTCHHCPRSAWSTVNNKYLADLHAVHTQVVTDSLSILNRKGRTSVSQARSPTSSPDHSHDKPAHTNNDGPLQRGHSFQHTDRVYPGSPCTPAASPR